MTKWFEFKDGSNPYGVWDNRQDEFFRMVTAWYVDIVDNNNFVCYEPTRAYYERQNYKFYKEALRDFAIMWQKEQERLSISYEQLAWYQTFFETYGKRYGLLREFRENGII